MGRVFRFLARIRAIFSKSSLDEDLDAELIHHLELLTEENIRNGMTEKEARRQARITFGGVEKIRELHREARGIAWLEHAFRDLKYSARLLWKSKGFSCSVIVTLALCIGLNAAIMSALYDLVLKPLPFTDSERLFQVRNVDENGAAKSNSAWSQYIDFKKNADLFEGFGFLLTTHKPIQTVEGAFRVRGQSVSADLFTLLGIRPLLGSLFSSDANLPGKHQVAVLPHSVWVNEYNSDPNIVGKQIQFSGETPYRIIGVAPRSVEVFDSTSRFIIPFPATEERFEVQDRYMWPLDLWTRLKKGTSHQAGLAQLKALERRWLEEVANAERRGRYSSKIDQIELARFNPLKSKLALLQAGSLLALLVGCVNVLSLILSRVSQKRHELSVRHGLGAGKIAVARLMLIESLLLMTVASVAGGILAIGCLHVINGYILSIYSSLSPVSLSIETLVSNFLITGVLALIMGLLPVTLLWRIGLLDKIDDSARTASMNTSMKLLGNSLVVGQVAIAFILLVGAGLLARSFYEVMLVDPGFEADRVVKGRISLRGIYSKEQRASARQRILAAMEEIPGVESVAWTIFESFKRDHKSHDFYLRGATYNSEGREIYPLQVVSPGYFETMGIPILEGRSFDSENSGDFIVDRTFAERHFPGGSALGAELFYQPQGPGNGKPWPRIIGVVDRANLQGLEARDGQAVIYGLAGESDQVAGFSILLRSGRPTGSLIQDMRVKLREVEPGLPLHNLGSLRETLDRQLLDRRGITLLLSCFAGLALTLSAVGVYSLLSYNVQQRRREIGIRRSLGASRNSVLRMIVHHGFLKAVIGLALGLPASFYLTRFLKDRLFDVTSLDPLTFLLAVMFLLSVALIASYLPARRAVKFDPLESLRAE